MAILIGGCPAVKQAKETGGDFGKADFLARINGQRLIASEAFRTKLTGVSRE
jgi:hypothetical protein